MRRSRKPQKAGHTKFLSLLVFQEHGIQAIASHPFAKSAKEWGTRLYNL